MRKTIYSMMVSVDGFIESAIKGLDWGSIDEELHRFINEQELGHGAHLYGRRMYETMDAYWPTPAATAPDTPDYIREYAEIWRRIPKYVFSRTLERIDGDYHLVRSDAAAEIRRLKEEPGGDIGIGGAEFATSLFEQGLIDDFHLFIHPVLIGDGKRMFPPIHQLVNLSLVDMHRFNSGVVFAHYTSS